MDLLKAQIKLKRKRFILVRKSALKLSLIKVLGLLFLIFLPLYSFSSSVDSKQSHSKQVISKESNSSQTMNLSKSPNLFLSSNKYQPYFELGGIKYFNQYTKGAGVYDLFLPLIQKENRLIFTDLRIFDRTGSSSEGNAHLGYRQLFSETKQMIGIYGSFDRKRSDHKKYFNQIMLGGEYWQDNWFVGGNIYKPVGRTKKFIDKKESASQIISHIAPIKSTINYYEKAQGGIDAELGHAFTESLTGYLGGYYFSADDTKTVSGPKIRLTYDYRPTSGKRLFNVLDGVSLEAGIQHDKPRGTSGYIGIKLKVGLTNSEKSSNISGFERHMVELVRRDPDIIIGRTQKTFQESFQERFYQEGEYGFTGGDVRSNKPYSERIDYENWPLEVLLKELDLSASASWTEARKAFRKLSLIHHPDQAGGDGAKQARINGVYEELRGRFQRPEGTVDRSEESSFSSRTSPLALSAGDSTQVIENSFTVFPHTEEIEVKSSKKVRAHSDSYLILYTSNAQPLITQGTAFQDRLSNVEIIQSNNSRSLFSITSIDLSKVELNQNELIKFDLGRNDLNRYESNRGLLETIGMWMLMPFRWIDYGVNVFFEILMPIKGASAYISPYAYDTRDPDYSRNARMFVEVSEGRYEPLNDYNVDRAINIGGIREANRMMERGGEVYLERMTRTQDMVNTAQQGLYSSNIERLLVFDNNLLNFELNSEGEGYTEKEGYTARIGNMLKETERILSDPFELKGSFISGFASESLLERQAREYLKVPSQEELRLSRENDFRVRFIEHFPDKDWIEGGQGVSKGWLEDVVRDNTLSGDWTKIRLGLEGLMRKARSVNVDGIISSVLKRINAGAAVGWGVHHKDERIVGIKNRLMEESSIFLVKLELEDHEINSLARISQDFDITQNRFTETISSMMEEVELMLSRPLELESLSEFKISSESLLERQLRKHLRLSSQEGFLFQDGIVFQEGREGGLEEANSLEREVLPKEADDASEGIVHSSQGSFELSSSFDLDYSSEDLLDRQLRGYLNFPSKEELELRREDDFRARWREHFPEKDWANGERDGDRNWLRATLIDYAGNKRNTNWGLARLALERLLRQESQLDINGITESLVDRWAHGTGHSASRFLPGENGEKEARPWMKNRLMEEIGKIRARLSGEALEETIIESLTQVAKIGLREIDRVANRVIEGSFALKRFRDDLSSRYFGSSSKKGFLAPSFFEKGFAEEWSSKLDFSEQSFPELGFSELGFAQENLHQASYSTDYTNYLVDLSLSSLLYQDMLEPIWVPMEFTSRESNIELNTDLSQVNLFNRYGLEAMEFGANNLELRGLELRDLEVRDIVINSLVDNVELDFIGESSRSIWTMLDRQGWMDYFTEKGHEIRDRVDASTEEMVEYLRTFMMEAELPALLRDWGINNGQGWESVEKLVEHLILRKGLGASDIKNIAHEAIDKGVYEEGLRGRKIFIRDNESTGPGDGNIAAREDVRNKINKKTHDILERIKGGDLLSVITDTAKKAMDNFRESAIKLGGIASAQFGLFYTAQTQLYSGLYDILSREENSDLLRRKGQREREAGERYISDRAVIDKTVRDIIFSVFPSPYYRRGEFFGFIREGVTDLLGMNVQKDYGLEWRHEVSTRITNIIKASTDNFKTNIASVGGIASASVGLQYEAQMGLYSELYNVMVGRGIEESRAKDFASSLVPRLDITDGQLQQSVYIASETLRGGAKWFLICEGAFSGAGGVLGTFIIPGVGTVGGLAVGAEVGVPYCTAVGAEGATASGIKAGFENVYFSKNSEKEGAGKSGVSREKVSRIVKNAGDKKGFFGLGSGTRAEADAAGRAWVGEGANWSSDGKAFVSQNKLRQYRPPSLKRGRGKIQANFQSRLIPKKNWINNGHLEIID